MQATLALALALALAAASAIGKALKPWPVFLDDPPGQCRLYNRLGMPLSAGEGDSEFDRIVKVWQHNVNTFDRAVAAWKDSPGGRAWQCEPDAVIPPMLAEPGRAQHCTWEGCRPCKKLHPSAALADPGQSFVSVGVSVNGEPVAKEIGQLLAKDILEECPPPSPPKPSEEVEGEDSEHQGRYDIVTYVGEDGVEYLIM